MKGLFGFGGKKDAQEVLKDKESGKKGSAKKSKKAASPSEAASKKSSTSTSSADAKASAAGSSGAKSKGPVKKLVSIPIGFTTTPAPSPQQPAAVDITRMRDRMRAFDASDRDRKLREEALNTLEGYTYRVRDLLEDEAFAAVSSDKQRSVIQSKSAAASDWLYGDGAGAPTEQLAARLTQLKELVEPILQRKRRGSPAARCRRVAARRDRCDEALARDAPPSPPSRPPLPQLRPKRQRPAPLLPQPRRLPTREIPQPPALAATATAAAPTLRKPR